MYAVSASSWVHFRRRNTLPFAATMVALAVAGVGAAGNRMEVSAINRMIALSESIRGVKGSTLFTGIIHRNSGWDMVYFAITPVGHSWKRGRFCACLPAERFLRWSGSRECHLQPIFTPWPCPCGLDWLDAGCSSVYR